RLLDAMTAPGPPTTMGELRAKLSPSKADLAELDAAIDGVTPDELMARMNDNLGGVSSGLNEDTDGLLRFRHFEMQTIRDGKRQLRRGLRRQPGKPTDAANDLLSGHFDDLLKQHPELGEQLRQTNDTLGLLKGIRDIYEKEFAEFTAGVERAKAE